MTLITRFKKAIKVFREPIEAKTPAEGQNEAARAVVVNAPPNLGTLEPRHAHRVKIAMQLAQQHGWRLVEHKPEQYMLRFKKDKDTLLDYWYSKNTVGTIVSHPKGHRTPLFRRQVNYAMLKALFINPRNHTGEGYYQK